MINNDFTDYFNNNQLYNFQYGFNSYFPIFKKGGEIKIKKKNRGSFTKYCGGNVTEECIRKGKNSPDPKIRKKAVFASNVRKFKHNNGGKLIRYNIDKLNELLNSLKKND